MYVFHHQHISFNNVPSACIPDTFKRCLTQGAAMDFARAWTTLVDMLNGFIAALPDLLLALLIFTCFYYLARRTHIFVFSLAERRQKARNLGIILGKLAQSAVIVTGLLVSLAVLFPSFKPGDLIQLLGIGSIAVGFAF